MARQLAARAGILHCMGSAQGFWLDLDHLRLTVVPGGDHWQAYVYDRVSKLVRYRAERMTVYGAKVAAVEFALAQLGGDPDSEDITERLRWKIIGKAATQ
jgi:hypothetical protein